ncbi:MAG: hypothetical protein A2163_02520 [Actinobacteria bacterium RBG_13_35_12]|uniref:C4-dicarboxylate ABC transporter substrate-binding protein n=1 Tax=Candidatus Sediminicultor quintus TaxID=1797291 RepID=A0A1F5ADJ1_9BACT|nr:MAG: hypothetical protein A2163_02520 [Actinobacteria bacterium RBG_13_35_12]OGD16004.1 MAG: hypothetical protein A2V47_06810 [Candidatus Atribacteria bacterium RBG_19FT_COMBO_35_14]
MSKNSILFSILLVIIIMLSMVLLGYSQTPALSSELPKVTWKWNFYAMSIEDEEMAKNLATQVIPAVKERTGGKFIIEALWGPELGIAPANYPKALASGALDLAWTYPGYNIGDIPIIGLCVLPMLVSNTEEYKITAEIFRPGYEKAYEEAYNGAVRLVVQGPYNWAQLVTTKPAKSIMDWSGLKIRVAGKVEMQYIETMGGTGLMTTWDEMVTSLRQGVVQGAFTDFGSMTNAKLYEMCKNVYVVNAMMGDHHVIMSTKSFDKLPKEYQDILLEEMAKAEAYNWSTIVPVNSRFGEALKTWEDNGANIFQATPEELKALSALCVPIWEKIASDIGPEAVLLLQKARTALGK